MREYSNSHTGVRRELGSRLNTASLKCLEDCTAVREGLGAFGEALLENQHTTHAPVRAALTSRVPMAGYCISDLDMLVRIGPACCSYLPQIFEDIGNSFYGSHNVHIR